MSAYTWSQWFAFFYLYCFVGWCFESAYVSFLQKHFVNRGFLRGPVLPLYGSGGMMMLLISASFPGRLVTMFFMGMICATVLEYLTGIAMEKLFKVRYWDYSQKKFNFQGLICLESTIAWGVLTVLFTEVVNKPVERLILGLDPSVLSVCIILVTAVFLLDLVTSVRAALDVAATLEAMTKARQELENLRVQLVLMREDVKDASANRIGLMKETAAIRIAEVKALPGKGIEYAKSVPEKSFTRLADLKADLQERFASSEEENRGKPEYLSLGQRIRDIRIPLPSPSAFIVRVQSALLRGNPDASSGRYADALRELKEQLLQRRDSGRGKTDER